MPGPLFKYQYGPNSRPQILLIGNGMEYESGQVSWENMLKNLTVENAICPYNDKMKDRIPFPLLYQLLVTPDPAPVHMTKEDRKSERERLAENMKTLKNESNRNLDQIPGLNMDHVMTTNYSYCLEMAFFKDEDFLNNAIRRDKLEPTQKKSNGDAVKETEYRLHTYYQAHSNDGRETGLWHIHGEVAVPGGIVLSHDRYGRLLKRIIDACGNPTRYAGNMAADAEGELSWPELFLYGDVYILGLGLDSNELDLWWLLRRKQREAHSQGRTVFYEREPTSGFTEDKHLLMRSCGVELCSAGCSTDVTYSEFYSCAFENIAQRVRKARGQL